MLSNNLIYQYILYFLAVVFFTLLIFLFRESKLHNSKGVYSPPKYDGENITPGKVFNEKD